MPEIIDFNNAHFIHADGETRQIFNIGIADTKLVINGLWYEQAYCAVADDGLTIIVKAKEGENV